MDMLFIFGIAALLGSFVACEILTKSMNKSYRYVRRDSERLEVSRHELRSGDIVLKGLDPNRGQDEKLSIARGGTELLILTTKLKKDDIVLRNQRGRGKRRSVKFYDRIPLHRFLEQEPEAGDVDNPPMVLVLYAAHALQ